MIHGPKKTIFFKKNEPYQKNVDCKAKQEVCYLSHPIFHPRQFIFPDTQHVKSHSTQKICVLGVFLWGSPPKNTFFKRQLLHSQSGVEPLIGGASGEIAIALAHLEFIKRPGNPPSPPKNNHFASEGRPPRSTSKPATPKTPAPRLWRFGTAKNQNLNQCLCQVLCTGIA